MLVIAGGVVYREFFLAEESKPVETGEVREITIVAKKNEWRFEPDEFIANRGDRVIVTVVNQDDYDHGFAIDALGISQRLPANSTIKIEFVVTQPGDFPFYCSVPCGEGDVVIDGETVHRSHFDQIGVIHVQDIVRTE